MSEYLCSSGEEDYSLYDRVDDLLAVIVENISNGSGNVSIPEQQPQTCRSKEFYTYAERQAILRRAMEARHCATEARSCAEEIQIESQLLIERLCTSQRKPLCDGVGGKVVKAA